MQKWLYVQPDLLNTKLNIIIDWIKKYKKMDKNFEQTFILEQQ